MIKVKAAPATGRVLQISLADHGIRLRRETPGEHRCPCPECAGAKARRGDDALAVKVEPDGACTWVCHRCSWRGGLPPAGAARRHFIDNRRRSDTRPPSAPGSLPGVAARLWAARRPIGPGTVAGRYLTSRGCALTPPDGDLAWCPDVWHPLEERAFPALLALVTHAVTGAPMTLHRTYLAPDGGGKAPVAKPRLLVKGGDKAGGVVRLWPDADVATGLCVAEGVETALTAARGFGLAWACLDAANIAGLPVLAGVEALTVVADHDAPNPKTGKRAGLEAAHECARRWLEAGREVRVWKAPAEGADLNDYARETAA